MADYVDRWGRSISVRHESAHPRGYYRRCEPRPGVTADDPPRYRRYTIEQLAERGDIDAGAPTTRQIRGDLYQQAFSQGLSAPRRARLLGAFREAKQQAYYQRRTDLENAAQAAGLGGEDVEELIRSWDEGKELRVVYAPGGRSDVVAIEQDGRVIGEVDRRAYSRALAELGGYLEEWEAATGRDLVEFAGDLGDLGDVSEEELQAAIDAGDLF